MDSYWDGEVEVCEDCYFAHHYGAHEHEGQWYAGESDTPADMRPLMRLLKDDMALADATNSETGEGMDTFSAWPCEGCGSLLAGRRFTLVYKLLATT